MKRIIALFILCSLGIAIQGEGRECQVTGITFKTKEECAKQCPSGCTSVEVI